MARESKFKKGMQVKSILNPDETYKVLEVLRNELRVEVIGKEDLIFSCKKSLFHIAFCLDCGEPLSSEQLHKGYCNLGTCGVL